MTTAREAVVMGECRDCRWWCPDGADRLYDIGFCQYASSDDPKMYAWGDNGVVYTKPDFGCNQFAPKEPQ